MILLIAVLLALPGFSALCISMKKHQRQVFNGPLPETMSQSYRRLGVALMALMVLWCMIMMGWSFGLVASCGVATVAALAVIITLTFRPQLVRFYCWLPGNGQT
ncbi:MAG: DUF3325 domain-containing protein [Pseudomonadota bacterium]